MWTIVNGIVLAYILITAAQSVIAWLGEHRLRARVQAVFWRRAAADAAQQTNNRSKPAAQTRAEFEAAVSDAVSDGVPRWKAYNDAVEAFRSR